MSVDERHKALDLAVDQIEKAFGKGSVMRLGDDAAIAVLDIGRMNHCVEQEPYRIDKDVALLALDFLARVVARWIDAGPPFSAPFTLWLSMTHAVGLASRPIASRHLTYSAWWIRSSVPS